MRISCPIASADRFLTISARSTDTMACASRQDERMKATILALVVVTASLSAADKIQNPKIDYQGYLKVALESGEVRQQRRITEEQFAVMSAEKDTIVLDARSADKYALRHIRGAISLPFTDFTAESLAKVIPAKETRVLIYCNNNFQADARAFAPKRADASLNISTFIALRSYGYTNVYELGPLLDVNTTTLPFEGASVK